MVFDGNVSKSNPYGDKSFTISSINDVFSKKEKQHFLKIKNRKLSNKIKECSGITKKRERERERERSSLSEKRKKHLMPNIGS
jgi:hypothetical protein